MAGALRLLFEWDKGRITLKEARPIAKRAPAGDQVPAGDRTKSPPQLGVTIELRSDDRSLYRRQVVAMFPDSHEVQTGDPARPFARAPRTAPYQVELVVPAPDVAARVVLTEHRADADIRKGGTPRVIVHVDEPLTQRPPRDDGRK